MAEIRIMSSRKVRRETIRKTLKCFRRLLGFTIAMRIKHVGSKTWIVTLYFNEKFEGEL